MITRIPFVRRLASIAALALVAGVVGAQASGGEAEQPRPAGNAPAGAPVSPVPAPPRAPGGVHRVPRGGYSTLLPPPASGVAILPSVRAGCLTPQRSTARRSPSGALTSTFGILRREREDVDALPPQALDALRRSGLEPVDAESARLLRADGSQRAWVVPVPDVSVAGPFHCARTGRAREGLAVVSVGGAPTGGGGELDGLRGGYAPVAMDPCAGTDRDMLGVSGIVPDGVEAVFVTAPDGSATRADVEENGYSFVLPRARHAGPRYLVWTAADGSPRVQPLPAVFSGARAACAQEAQRPRVSPDAVCIHGSLERVVTAVPRSSNQPRANRSGPARRRGRPPALPRVAAPLQACALGALVSISPSSGRLLAPHGLIPAPPPATALPAPAQRQRPERGP